MVEWSDMKTLLTQYIRERGEQGLADILGVISNLMTERPIAVFYARQGLEKK